MARRPSRALQRCLTLIELMIAITIGMLVVALVLAVFLATNRSSQTQDAAAQLDDNGRFALETITRVVRLAGYRNWGGPLATQWAILLMGAFDERLWIEKYRMGCFSKGSPCRAGRSVNTSFKH